MMEENNEAREKRLIVNENIAAMNSGPASTTGVFGNRARTAYACFLAVLVAAAMVSLWTFVFTVDPNLKGVDQLDLLRLRQISFCVSTGLLFALLGVFVCWIGLDASVKLKGSASGASLALATSSPGAMLIVGGTILVAIAALRPYKHETQESQTPGAPGVKEGNEKIAPAPLAAKSSLMSMSGETLEGAIGFWASMKDEAKNSRDGKDRYDWAARLKIAADGRLNALEGVQKDLKKSNVQGLDYSAQVKFYGAVKKAADAVLINPKGEKTVSETDHDNLLGKIEMALEQMRQSK